MNLSARFPKLHQVVPVFAVIAFLVYGWTTYRFLQKLPSWLFYLNIQEILLNYSQTLFFNFLESLIFLGMVVGLSALLPKKYFMDLFVARGTLLALLGLGYLIYLSISIGESKASQFPWEIFNWSPIIGLAVLILSIFLPRVSIAQKTLESMADRAVIFLYILMPLSGLGVLVFVIDNLF